MFQIVTALVLMAAATGLAIPIILRDRKNGYGVISIFSLYFAFVVIDQFIPAIAMIITGVMPPKPYYVPHFDRQETALAASISAITFILIIFGYLAGYAFARRKGGRSADRLELSFSRMMIGFVIVLVIFGITEVNIISSMGGVIKYFFSMVQFRRSVFEQSATTAAQSNFMLSAISRDVILSVCATMFAERQRLGKNRLGWLFLALGVLTSMTTFYRGTVILFGLMVIATSQIAMQGNTQRLERTSDIRNIVKAMLKKKKYRRRIVLALVVFTLLFTGFGAVRSYLGAEQWGVANYSLLDGVEKQMSRFTEGAGLYSLVNIVHSFPHDVPYLNGSSIYHQLVRYVPRTILPDKPKNYGAVEVTTALGYPLTGDAVTVPGELWANFGFPGLPLVILLGLFFGFLTAQRDHPQLKYFYSTIGFGIVLAVGWFSFTGFMSWLPSAITIWIFLKITRPRRSRR